MKPRLLHVRFASSSTSSSSAFPFPTHPRPTAHQVFHLPPNASRREIKARYYDLVRVHHPDSFHSRVLSHSVRQSRFQAITAAYEVLLRGSGPSRRLVSTEDIRQANAWGAPPWRPSNTAYRKQRYQDEPPFTYRYSPEWTHSPDDRWKDWIIVFAGILSLVVSLSPGLFIFPSALDARHRMASANLARARRDAKQYGEERRNDVRRRVAARRSRESHHSVNSANQSAED